jgi:colicin import membrane protein
MSTLANLPAFEADAKAIEAARIATLAWGKATAKAEGLSSTMGAAIKAAWPLRDQADKAKIRGWIVEAAISAQGKDWGEIYNAPAPAKDQIAGSAWKRAHNMIDNRMRLAVEAAYPVVPTVPAAPILTTAQIVAKAATETAKAESLAAAQAATDAEIAKAEASVKAAEAKAEAARVKAAEAAAKLDPTKAAEAETAKVKAEAAAKSAAEAKAEAEAAEKIKVGQAAAAKAAQAEADAKCLAIQTEKKYGILVADTESLLLLAGGLAAPGIVDFATAVRNALAALKAAQV